MLLSSTCRRPGRLQQSSRPWRRRCRSSSASRRAFRSMTWCAPILAMPVSGLGVDPEVGMQT